MIALSLAVLAAAPAQATQQAIPLPPEVAHVLKAPRFKQAQQALDADHDHLVEQIIALTEIPSPPFGEEARGKAYADLQRASGLTDVTIDGIGNVVGTRPGLDHTLPPLVVAAHLDTVFPKGTDVHVRREGTHLMAPGVGDDSRGLAVLLAMVRAMDKAGVQTKRDILFVGDVGEEGQGDLRGMRYLFRNNPRAARAAAFISVDSSGASGVVTHGVGSRRYHIVFSGPGGHSYDKFGIVNPMVPLAKVVNGLYAIPVPAEPKTTYSASVVGGGTSVNTIPPKVFLDVDIRSTAPEEVARVDKALHDIAERAIAEENVARSTARGSVSVAFELIGDRPAGHTAEDKGLAAMAFAASRGFGYAPRFIAVSTDANIPMSLGIPAIAIGSGGSGGAEHSPDEAIDVAKAESVRGISVALATVLSTAGIP